MNKTQDRKREAVSIRRLIESDTFPFEFVSELAEMESWRKEIHRPVYHIHKWWAKRLGSVFRAILLGCALPESESLATAFYRKHDFAGRIVFDPFMGSGTTVGEAHKLGFTALGRDINPVACEAVRVAFGPLDRDALLQAFGQLSSGVGERIRKLYRTTDSEGHDCDALYFFWVKTVPCPACARTVDLFPSYIFARNAYPDRKPDVRVYCPQCAGIFTANVNDQRVKCTECRQEFSLHDGPAAGANARCQNCHHTFAIAKAVKALGRPPSHRMFAKLVLNSSDDKIYLPINPTDEQAYQKCSEELATSNVPLPTLELEDGYNTRQVLNYAYRSWREFFNHRQLLALGWLYRAILQLPNETSRSAMLNVFSGTLEFNNTFASYKGEGTGAIRHMFSHHILKPERVPIEGNVWGTSKSSGAFSTLFKSRLLRAIEYRLAPFEVAVDRAKSNHSGRRVYGCSDPFSGHVEIIWPPSLPTQEDFTLARSVGERDGVRRQPATVRPVGVRPGPLSNEGKQQGEGMVQKPRAIYLSCGNSANTGLKDRSVDLVVTDPPFFDNVHYSELADFFFAWQQLWPLPFAQTRATTRHSEEVQDVSAEKFANKLQAVFAECSRVLKDDGLLVFTYHHSRSDGWTALAEAIAGTGFSVMNCHPVKSEMSVATPKSQAKEPIQLDAILVCRKAPVDSRTRVELDVAMGKAISDAKAKATRLQQSGLDLSANDRRVVLIGQFLAEASPGRSGAQLADAVSAQLTDLDLAALRLLDESLSGTLKSVPPPKQASQLVLLEGPAKHRD